MAKCFEVCVGIGYSLIAMPEINHRDISFIDIQYGFTEKESIPRVRSPCGIATAAVALTCVFWRRCTSAPEDLEILCNTLMQKYVSGLTAELGNGLLAKRAPSWHVSGCKYSAVTTEAGCKNGVTAMLTLGCRSLLKHRTGGMRLYTVKKERSGNHCVHRKSSGCQRERG